MVVEYGLHIFYHSLHTLRPDLLKYDATSCKYRRYFRIEDRTIWKHWNILEPNVLQFAVVYAFIGLPLVYIQVVIGQYTQMSIIFIKYMCPIAHGVAYTALLNILSHAIERSIYLAIFMVYMLTSLRTDLQWLVCSQEFADICWNGNNGNCTANCLTNKTLSAEIYYR